MVGVRGDGSQRPGFPRCGLKSAGALSMWRPLPSARPLRTSTQEAAGRWGAHTRKEAPGLLAAPPGSGRDSVGRTQARTASLVLAVLGASNEKRGREASPARPVEGAHVVVTTPPSPLAAGWPSGWAA